MASKSAKRRAKKRAISTRQMQQQWQAHDVRPVKREEDPRVTVLSARCRQMNRDDTEDARLSLTWPGFGDPAGVALDLGVADRDERNALWDLFKRLDAADDAYIRRYVGVRRFPNVAKVEFLPERFETSADDPLDTRSADEKDRDAVNGWMRWQGLLGRMSAADHTAIVTVMRRRVEPVAGASLTTAGWAFVAAMKNLLAVERNA